MERLIALKGWARRSQGMLCCVLMAIVMCAILLIMSFPFIILFGQQYSDLPIYISADPTFSSVDGTILTTCSYPSSNISTPTSLTCLITNSNDTYTPNYYGNETTWYCPEGYICVAQDDSPPYCNLPSCGSDWCEELVEGFNVISGNDLVREIPFSINIPWYGVSLFVLSVLVTLLVTSIPVIFFFRHKIEWVPEEGSEDTTLPGEGIQSFDSMNMMLIEGDFTPWTGKEIFWATVIGGGFFLVSICLIVPVGCLAGLMVPSLPSIDSYIDNDCFTDNQLFKTIRWSISLSLVFTLLSLFGLLFLCLLLMAAKVHRVHKSLYNPKACCALWTLLLVTVIAIVILSLAVALT